MSHFNMQSKQKCPHALLSYMFLRNSPHGLAFVQETPLEMGPMQFAAGSQQHDLGRCSVPCLSFAYDLAVCVVCKVYKMGPSQQ